ncbi:peptidase [Thraustotheca clavata]|uniref:Peptidase n=1 Tax=Thraustotheca clavata TaxID=74557 RepID=A0A1V9ZVB5_9STRA|nr:peptidase [Thraustotheca clavata]
MFLLVAIIAYLVVIDGCTIVAVTKAASIDNTSLTAHTDDTGGGAVDLRLVHVPAMDHPPNSTRFVYGFHPGYPRLVTTTRGPMYVPLENQALSIPLGGIPQINHTFAYFDHDYGIMNEKQLSIAESTCSARTVGWPIDLPYGYNLFSIAELTKIALERCESARCAVQTMGDLAVKYGFYSTDSDTPEKPGYDDSAEALSVSDKFGETWIFHVLTGPQNASAVWAAQRVPDGHLTAVANFFTIREMNLTDKDNYMASDNVISFAKEMNWWRSEDGPFDFTKAYAQEFSGPVVPLYGGRRIWRIFDWFAPSLQLDSTLGSLPNIPTYPFSLKPDKLVTLESLMELLKDHYEGTEYDMTIGLAAGPFGSPIRYDSNGATTHGGWERSISMHRTLFSFVLQSAETLPSLNSLGGTMWFGQSAPHGTLYVPFSSTQKSIPKPFLVGSQSHFKIDSLWWVFTFVNNWSYLRFNVINAEVRKVALTYQQQLIATRNEFYKSDTTIEVFEKWNHDITNEILHNWWNLAWRLVSTYSDGFQTLGEESNEMHVLGYPDWWLNATEYRVWPGNSFRLQATTLTTTIAFPQTKLESLLYGTLGVAVGIGIVLTWLTVRRRNYMRLD